MGVVGRAHKVDLARDCGCSVVIDKSADDLWATARREAPDGFDVIFGASAGGWRHCTPTELPQGGADCAVAVTCASARRRRCQRGRDSGRQLGSPRPGRQGRRVWVSHHASAARCASAVARHRAPRASSPLWVDSIPPPPPAALCPSALGAGGVLGVLEWAKLAVAYLRTPRFNPLEMTSSNRSVMAFNLSFMFDKVEVLERAMSDLHRWCAAAAAASAAAAVHPP